MNNLFLKPHVHKVQGCKNYCLYDLLNEELIQVIPQGSVAELKKNLLENNLIFETAGVVPCKMAIPSEEVNSVSKNRLHVVQLHLSGNIGQTCWVRAMHAHCDDPVMSEQVLDEILVQIGRFPIKKIQVYYNFISTVQIEKIARVQSLVHIELYPVGNISAAAWSKGEGAMDPGIRICMEPAADPLSKGVDFWGFEKNKSFNPCLANQVAFSITGEIKPCLWFAKSMGNIMKDDFVLVIREQINEQYWQLSKDKIDVCKSCEFRYGCHDCRVMPNGEVNEAGKPAFCQYDPSLGIEYEG